jgi:hypothetical protein
MAAKTEKIEHTVAAETSIKVQEFVAADQQFRATMTDFEEKAPEWFKLIEEQRDLRNRRLDDAKRALRDEAGRLDYTKIKSFKAGPFTVEKARNRSFDTLPFIEIADGLGIDDQLKDAGIIVTETSINRDQAVDWLKRNNLWDKFAETFREEDATARVKGADDIPPLGMPAKGK